MCTRSPLVDVKAGLRIPILSSSDDQSHKSRSFNNKYMKKQKRRLQRSISRSYEKNKKGESYCKTNNVIKKEKLLLKRNH